MTPVSSIYIHHQDLLLTDIHLLQGTVIDHVFMNVAAVCFQFFACVVQGLWHKQNMFL